MKLKELKDYQDCPYKEVREYVMDEKSALEFSFLRQGIEPDRTELTRSIYRDLFVWYDEKKHSGDTLITYRTAILRKFEKKSYTSLTEERQHQILNTVKKFTKYGDYYPFEFIQDNGISKQICNPYQVGNFGIFPKGKINTRRAQSPYNDYFDLMLLIIKDFYEQKIMPDEKDSLRKAVFEEKDYFNLFSDFEDYKNKNFLHPFFDEKGHLIALSEIDNFPEYVRVSNEIIQRRGMAIIGYLREKYDLANPSGNAL